MLKKLLDIRIILIFILVLAIAALCIFGYMKKQEYDGVIAQKDEDISSLESQLNDIGVLVPVYVLNSDVKSGKLVEESDFDIVDVPQVVAENLITDLEAYRLELGLVPYYDDEVETETEELSTTETIVETKQEDAAPVETSEDVADGTEVVENTEETEVAENTEVIENVENTENADVADNTAIVENTEETKTNSNVKLKRVNNALYYKTDMTAGTVLTKDSIYSEILKNDMRIVDVSLDVLPVGIQVGDYIDVRIKFGTGADYVGIAHRQVHAIYGNVLKLVLTEKDIQMFSSMLVDSIVFNTSFELEQDKNGDGKIDSETEKETMRPVGAYLYAIPYVEGGIQQETKVTYAPSRLVQALMGKDVNINSNDLTETDLAFFDNFRLAFNKDLNTYLFKTDIGEKVLTATTIRETVQNKVKEAQRVYEKMVEAAEEQARREAEG